MELQSNPEGVTWKGSKKFYRSGPWNGIGFSGAPEIKANSLFYFNFISNDQEVSYSFSRILTVLDFANEHEEAKAKPKIRIAVITVATIAVILGMLVAIYYLRKRKAKGAGKLIKPIAFTKLQSAQVTLDRSLSLNCKVRR
ncbi:RECEPTOR-LIKE SERINE/THREONINE-PROTEIN KINASE SD1-8 [Salix viminalis]|uniref:RECEPTOR-LIKE SERINE/THREONINE-PROTEIN KINASE SD1-8 n=1 Tax=Salix viminalis TaxID=40686 RepID=A0A9Q0U6J7_SALVM|nr:RECEPTOR-LIKE SERINE/THREONINE-PROTEIN KINASE SD1-8 [Salix viminalis]